MRGASMAVFTAVEIGTNRGRITFLVSNDETDRNCRCQKSEMKIGRRKKRGGGVQCTFLQKELENKEVPAKARGIWRFGTRLLGTTTANQRHHAENPQPRPRPPIAPLSSATIRILFLLLFLRFSSRPSAFRHDLGMRGNFEIAR